MRKEIDNHWRRVGKKNIWRLGFVLFFLVSFSSKNYAAEDIVIFSTTIADETKTTKMEGVFDVSIKAFSEIREVRLNGKPIAFPAGLGTTVTIPYRLNPGKNRFEIFVKTAEDKKRQTFLLNLIDPHSEKEKEKKGLNFIALLGLKQTNNAKTVSDDQEKTTGTKVGVTLIPAYKFPFDESNFLRFQGILLRESYNEEELEPYDTQVSQLSAQWDHRPKNSLLHWATGIGWNYIEGEYDSFFADEYRKETNKFFFVALNLVHGDYSFGLHGEFKDKDAEFVPENPNYDEDAVIYSLALHFRGKWGSDFSFSAKAGKQETNTAGKYKDRTQSALALKLKTRFDHWFLSLGGNYKEVQYQIYDPLLMVRPLDKKSSYKAGITVAFSEELLGMLEFRKEKQTSNVANHNYTNTGFALSGIYLY